MCSKNEEKARFDTSTKVCVCFFVIMLIPVPPKSIPPYALNQIIIIINTAIWAARYNKEYVRYSQHLDGWAQICPPPTSLTLCNSAKSNLGVLLYIVIFYTNTNLCKPSGYVKWFICQLAPVCKKNTFVLNTTHSRSQNLTQQGGTSDYTLQAQLQT